MNFQYQKSEHLPPLAWLAHLDFRAHRIDAYGGASVEVGSNWLFEGAWSGRFSDGDFCRADHAFGSGLRIEGTRILVCPPSSTLESVFFYVSRPSRVMVSNSAIAIMAVTGDRPKLDRTHYLRWMETSRFGPDAYLRTIPLSRYKLHRVLYDCIEFRGSEQPHRLKRTDPPAFRDFTSYREYLSQQLRELISNATARERGRVYQPLATISSGYDSPTCAALVRELGCRRAVSFSHAREQFASADDSGTEIGSALGLDVMLFDRLDYLKHKESHEPEFLSTGLGGEDIVFASCESELRGACVFTGCLGDKIWGFDYENIGLNIARADNGGGSLGEYRLAADFIHIPVPYIGISRQREILAISESDEMKPWRVGGDYDRPIARRITETAGVPRAAFGTAKKAVTNAIGSPLLFSFEVLHPDAASSFRAFLARHDISERTLPSDQRLRRALWKLALFVVERLVWRKASMPVWAKRLVNRLECWVSVLEPAVGNSAWLYHWSVEARARAYSSITTTRSGAAQDCA